MTPMQKLAMEERAEYDNASAEDRKGINNIGDFIHMRHPEISPAGVVRRSRQENRWQHHHDEHERRHDERERRHDERLRHEEWAEHPHMSGWEPWSHDDFGEEP